MPFVNCKQTFFHYMSQKAISILQDIIIALHRKFIWSKLQGQARVPCIVIIIHTYYLFGFYGRPVIQPTVKIFPEHKIFVDLNFWLLNGIICKKRKGEKFKSLEKWKRTPAQKTWDRKFSIPGEKNFLLLWQKKLQWRSPNKQTDILLEV